jgi:hypothetical protein
MKKLVSFLILLFIVKGIGYSQCNATLVTSCTKNVSSEEVFLQQYRAKLGKASSTDMPVARFSVLLTKGNIYRFNICSAMEFEGEGVLQLNDGERIVASTYHAKSRTDFKAFEFFCSKTAIYNIYISFLDGRQGCAVGILSIKK